MDLTWECPEVEVPADAWPWQEDHGVVDAAVEALWAEAVAFLPEDCTETTEETTWDFASATTTTTTCVSGEATVTRTEYAEDTTTSHWSGASTYRSDTWVFARVEGAWTSLTFATSSAGANSDSWSENSVSWSGEPLGLAPDSGFSFEYSYDTSMADIVTTASVSTPTCGWSWQWAGDYAEVTIDGGPEVEVFSSPYDTCGSWGSVAFIDDVLFGAVDGYGWGLTELDRDGYSVEDGDCDDADPAFHPCAEDVPHDGIDQDCDGVDNLDGDGDGWDEGADCDDASAEAWPGADDAAGDGVDQDCDGHDDVDADGDGWTADGDAEPIDCDDADPAVHPGATELAGAVDEDCDGDGDGDGSPAPEDCDDGDYEVNPLAMEIACNGLDDNCRGGDACEVEAVGCAHAPHAGWAALLALAALARRIRS